MKNLHFWSNLSANSFVNSISFFSFQTCAYIWHELSGLDFYLSLTDRWTDQRMYRHISQIIISIEEQSKEYEIETQTCQQAYLSGMKYLVFMSKIALLSSLKMSLYCDGIICFPLKKVSPCTACLRLPRKNNTKQFFTLTFQWGEFPSNAVNQKILDYGVLQKNFFLERDELVFQLTSKR